jgi:peptide/nickel transport system ATP-binding protein
LVQESGPLPSPDIGLNTDPDKVLLEVRDFSLRFRGAPSDQINHVNFAVQPGKTLCVVGESGCGKSVTSLAMMGLLPEGAATIRSGEMVFEGQKLDLADHTAMRKLRGSRMTMIFQEPMTSLNPAFRIGDQITEAVLAHSNASKSEAEEKALVILERVGIPAAEKRMRDYPHQLSGGMRQRVMIAMALVNDPALLIADEPTTALDVTIQAQILELIRDLQAETDMGTIMITHDLGVVAEIADTVAVMYAGTIVETGPAERIFNDPQHPYTIGLMSSIPQLSGPRGRLATVPGMVPTTQNMPEGCRFATRCPFAQPVCKQEPPLAPIEGGHAVACHFAPLETHLEQSA